MFYNKWNVQIRQLAHDAEKYETKCLWNALNMLNGFLNDFMGKCTIKESYQSC